MKYLIPIIFISLSLGIYFFLIKKNTNSTENVTSEIDAKNLMPYKIDKKDYYRYILLNKTTENHLINMIIEYGDLSGNQYYEEHNFEIAELNKWYIIKVPETIDFYVYHNLVGWFNGYEENLNNPQFSIGFSKHKLKSQKDYIFYLDPNNEYGDTHIGNLEMEVLFLFIYLMRMKNLET